MFFITYSDVFIRSVKKNHLRAIFYRKNTNCSTFTRSKNQYMNRIIVSLLALTTLIAACNNNKPKEEVVISNDGKEKVSIDANSVDKMKAAAEEMQKQKLELEKLTPLTLDQLKALIPETLIGGKRTSYDVNASMGANVANGEYELNDSTKITLTIYDCAGSAGAGIYGMQYLGLLNVQQESDEEYTKTIDINGGKGFEHCDKVNHECTVTFFSGGRFLVALEANNIPAEALKEAAAHMNIK